MNKFSDDLRRIQVSLSDAAKIGRREILRSVDVAKRQIERVHFIQKRKELFAELGRTLYDAYRDGLPEQVATFIKETEFHEIIDEIAALDTELERRQNKS